MNIKNSLGLSFDFLDNGSIKHIEVDPIRISLKSSTPYSKSGANLYLRKRGKPFEFKPILGPESNSSFQITENAYFAKGSWDGIDYSCVLQLSTKSLSWQWRIDITNTLPEPVELDLIYMQDIGLKSITNGLVNEYYVSQYLERLILEDHQFGSVICCRQNMKESVGNPWFIVACPNSATSASTDGMQFYGKTYRETGIPEGLIADSLGGNYAGESSMIALQEKPFKLASKEEHKSVFVASYLPYHPAATSESDLKCIQNLILEFQDEVSLQNEEVEFSKNSNIFNTAAFLPVDDLSSEELIRFFGQERRHSEVEKGELLSFFNSHKNYVMLRTKELMVDRPHGHIIQAKAGYEADENIVSTTSYAFGIFNSHVTQGNTNFNIFLSVCTSQYNQSPESGQRIFVEIEGRKYLLGVPSAFEIGLNHCRWIYKFGDYCFQVRTWSSKKSPQINLDFKVINGKKVKILITHHLDESNGWSLSDGSRVGTYVFKPKKGTLISEKFPDAQFQIIVNGNYTYKTFSDEILYNNSKSHDDPFFVIKADETTEFCMSIIGEVCSHSRIDKIENADKQFDIDCKNAQSGWADLSLNLSLQGKSEDISAIQEILPWFGMNAITHFLTPHGLEQFGGAAWGTRDVSQGPLDLLLTMEKYDAAKQVLLKIFSNQNTEGDWPQWWMFDSYFNIRANDCHGDVYYWCIIALSSYIKVTGDIKILDEVLPYYHEKGVAFAEKTPLHEHLERLIDMIVNSFIPGTALVPFGGGDWNDSLQPVSKELAQRMISSWTVEMNYQAFNQYRIVYEQTGNFEKAKKLKEICDRIRSDFNKYLIKDGIVAGYGLVEKDNSISVLLHPSDTKTGINYSILPMNRGIISEIFTKDQALHHQEIIERYLKGPDGARLMDRPLKYRGGVQSIFQRAESSTFFGREIGLMYVHEHIRYAESLAIMGKADAFVKALRQANPVAYRNIVTCGDIRQSNCYYSSSDVIFKSRYDADERYDDVKKGNFTLKGGWRVYSSGPGIYVGLVVSRLLGLRTEFGNTIIDPVIPSSMDCLCTTFDYFGFPLTFKYFIKEGNYSPKVIRINGEVIKITYENNKFRLGGAIFPTDKLLLAFSKKENYIEIEL